MFYIDPQLNFFFLRLYITVLNKICTSKKEILVNNILYFSAPCLSTSVSAIVDCATDSALVSWSVMVGVENYTVMALGSGGQRFSCSSQQNHCNISSLPCGQLYNLTFTSTNQQCQITSATNVTFQSSEFAIHYGSKGLKVN